jgi:predicted ArsR family transcriptional regulator
MQKKTPAPSIEMRSGLDTSDLQFLRMLHRLGASSVQQLCEKMGVTATAVRQRITRLQSEGYLERETVRATRGRPYHLYQLTAEGIRQLGDDFGELAQILWQEVQAIEDESLRNSLLARIRQSLVRRYDRESASESLVDRFEELGETLLREGFDVEVETRDAPGGALPILREHFCPYHDMAAEDSTICDLEQAVFGDVLGVPVKLTHCFREGDSCCEFEPVLTE